MKYILSDLNDQETWLLAKMLLSAPVSRKWVHDNSPWAKSKTDIMLREIKNKGLLKTVPIDNSKSGRNPFEYFGSRQLGYTIGVELSLAADRIAILDINGETISCSEYEASYPVSNVTRSISAHIEKALQESSLSVRDLNAIGIATYGIFDQDLSQILKFQNNVQEGPIPVREPLQQYFQLPVYLGRAKELVCYKEYKETLILSKRTFLNVNMNYGVGLGIFINGENYLGTKGLSGDLSHIKVEGNERQCYCGDTGCLITLLSYQGLCRQALSRFNQVPESGSNPRLQLDLLEGPDFEAGVNHLTYLALHNDKIAMNIIHEAGLILGKTLASAVSILAPEIVIIHSNLTKTNDLFNHPLALTVRRNCHTSIAKELEIRFSELEPYSIAEGSAIHARDTFLQDIIAGLQF